MLPFMLSALRAQYRETCSLRSMEARPSNPFARCERVIRSFYPIASLARRGATGENPPFWGGPRWFKAGDAAFGGVILPAGLRAETPLQRGWRGESPGGDAPVSGSDRSRGPPENTAATSSETTKGGKKNRLPVRGVGDDAEPGTLSVIDTPNFCLRRGKGRRNPSTRVGRAGRHAPMTFQSAG